MAEVQRPMIAAMERGPGPKYAPELQPIKKKAPAFSFGKRSGKDISKIDDSPGPKYSIDEKLTTKGSIKNPSFSLSSRHKDPIPYNTPGPGSYQVKFPSISSIKLRLSIQRGRIYNTMYVWIQ